jgi:thioredoxin reductase
MHKLTSRNKCQVAVIGSGPSGIGAALALKQAGIPDIVILERETDPGGVPRHCGHPPFGLREHHRILTGPDYARLNVRTARAAGVDIFPATTVTRLEKGGLITFSSPAGIGTLQAEKVLLATGTRETPRAPRFVSGGRPQGICTTGALQSMYYLKNMVPFCRPVIVGSEIVSFSALWTCNKAGIRPVAMLEKEQSPQVRWPVNLASAFFRVPLLSGTRIIHILGREKVNGVLIETRHGQQQELACDGVLFTGMFTPEASLARLSHLDVDPLTGCPIVDHMGRCSDPSYFAAGNVIHAPVKVAGKCWLSGQSAGLRIAEDLRRGKDHI